MKTFNPHKLFVGAFIPNCLMEFKGISSTSKLVWARLSQYAGQNGEAYPKQETLAVEVGISKRQVISCLKELEEKGFIIREKASGKDILNHKTNRYRFVFHACFRTSGGEADFTSGDDVDFTSYKKENHRKKKLFVEDSIEFRLSEKFLGLIQKNKPNVKKPNLQSWARCFDLILRVDGRSVEDVERLMAAVQNDEFWMANVMSPNKLREKWDQLEMKLFKKSVSNRPGEGLLPHERRC